MVLLARFSLLLVITLVVVSAYLRLQHSGIGCPDWPACYGNIGAPAVEAPDLATSAYQRIVAESSAPLGWAAPLHRLVASLLGLCIFFLVVLAFRNGRNRLVSLALLALTVFLAMIGLRSGSLHNTAIVMGNIMGGFCMVGLLGWIVFRQRIEEVDPGGVRGWLPFMKPAIILAIALLCLQVFLGGLTSANFAALACGPLPDCQGSYWPGADLAGAMNLAGSIDVSPTGWAVGGSERLAIQKAHRIGAVICVLVLIPLALVALRRPATKVTAIWIAGLVSLEFSVGIMAIVSDIPIGLAVAHNWLAAMLLLALVNLLARNSPQPAT